MARRFYNADYAQLTAGQVALIFACIRPRSGDHLREPGRLPVCGCDYLMLGSASGHQLRGLLIVAITAYWQHVVVDDRGCPVVTW